MPRQSERAELRELRERLHQFMDYAHEIFYLKDRDLRYLAMNRSGLRTIGLSEAELLGKRDDELFPASVARRIQSRERQVLDSRELVSFDGVLPLGDGRRFVYTATLFPVMRDGEAIGLFGQVEDLSDLHDREVRLERTAEELEETREHLIQSERLAAIGKMAAGVAHEINNPLAIMDNLSGLLRETIEENDASLPVVLRDDLLALVGKLDVQTRRCSTVTHSLLGFVRKPRGTPVPVSVPRLLDEALSLLQLEVVRLELDVVRNYAADLPDMVVEPTQLEHVFVNLLQNALDAVEEHAPKQGRLELSVGLIEAPDEARSVRLAVTVADNGVGIPRGELKQIFDLFHTSKPAGKGTGLGLSIVHDVLRHLGGEIRVESEVGEGSRFTLLLPLAPPGT